MPQVNASNVSRDMNSMEVAFEVTTGNRLRLTVKADKFSSHAEFYQRQDGLQAAIGVFQQALKNNPPARFETSRVEVQKVMETAELNGVAPAIDVDLKRFDGSTVPSELALVS